jgi:hypothetical protein
VVFLLERLNEKLLSASPLLHDRIYIVHFGRVVLTIKGYDLGTIFTKVALRCTPNIILVFQRIQEEPLPPSPLN